MPLSPKTIGEKIKWKKYFKNQPNRSQLAK